MYNKKLDKLNKWLKLFLQHIVKIGLALLLGFAAIYLVCSVVLIYTLFFF